MVSIVIRGYQNLSFGSQAMLLRLILMSQSASITRACASPGQQQKLGTAQNARGHGDF